MTSIAPLTRSDYSRVRVDLTVGTRRVALGSADDAVRDARLSAGERQAIVAMVRAVRLLGRMAVTGGGSTGVDDAKHAVQLTLRDADATQGGPWSSELNIAVGSTNALAGRTAAPARRGILLPLDVAIHELTHLLQFRRMAEGAKPCAPLLEGIADSVAMLVTGDTLLGEGYFATGRTDALRGAVRDLDPDARRTATMDVVGPTLTTYEAATRAGVDEHDGGGVISTIFLRLAKQFGRATTQRLLWAVISDDAAWRTGGSWRSFTDALRRAAAAIADPALTAAVTAEIQRSGLHAAK